MKYGIIGGTYIESIPGPYVERAVSTPYGDIVVLERQLDNGDTMYFLSRHGVMYEHEPSRINSRANVYGMYKLGVTHLIGITSVGACDYSYKLGSYCLLSDFLDFTKTRNSSFERAHRLSLHTGMEDVFDPDLTDALERAIKRRNLAYSGRGVYACIDGPRFETAAETRMLRLLGAQIVGATIVPEAPLAKSIGMRYACLAIISNHCTGMAAELRDEAIKEVVRQCRTDAVELCFDLVNDTVQTAENSKE
ncbi:MAG: MTAP family purine nucleoside phosphorylase [Clostridia bacterium]|nr:MTAP family purine nucleoside phosphorylase [Clostridia bacterium]